MGLGPDSDGRRLRARVVISGLVQGVYFRATARQMALRHGLCGWVRNRADGKVEALVEGESAAVQAFIAWCHEGPRGARVTDVQVAWEPYKGDVQGFRIAG
jgi:acylphosphatase